MAAPVSGRRHPPIGYRNLQREQIGYRNLIRYVPAPDTVCPMAERDQLQRALKQVLKLRGRRYADLARGLGVSEPTVKRMLSTGRIDLARLERICGLLDIDLFELVRLARGARAEREHLEPVQEEALAADPRLLLVFHLLRSDERRAGNECVSPCRSSGSPHLIQNN